MVPSLSKDSAGRDDFLPHKVRLQRGIDSVSPTRFVKVNQSVRRKFGAHAAAKEMSILGKSHVSVNRGCHHRRSGGVYNAPIKTGAPCGVTHFNITLLRIRRLGIEPSIRQSPFRIQRALKTGQRILRAQSTAGTKPRTKIRSRASIAAVCESLRRGEVAQTVTTLSSGRVISQL